MGKSKQTQTSKTKVFDTPWFSISKISNSKCSDYYCLDTEDGVFVVAITHENQFILVRQYRPCLDRDSIEIVAGGMQPRETPRRAAQRELEEETGYTSRRWISLGCYTCMADRVSASMHGFLALEAYSINQIARSNMHEKTQPFLVTEKQLHSLLKEKKIDQLESIAFLGMAMQRLKSGP